MRVRPLHATMRWNCDDLLAAGEARLALGLLQAVAAQVIGAALEQRGRHADAERIAHARQVAVVELVLQRAGAGGDDRLQPRQQRRHEVGEGLAGAGAGFGEQHVARVERVGDRLRQPLLRRARNEAGNGVARARRLRRAPRGCGSTQFDHRQKRFGPLTLQASIRGLGRGRARGVAARPGGLFDRRPVAAAQRPDLRADRVRLAREAFGGRVVAQQQRDFGALLQQRRIVRNERERLVQRRGGVRVVLLRFQARAPARAGPRPSGRAAAGPPVPRRSSGRSRADRATIASGDAFVSAAGATGGGGVAQAPQHDGRERCRDEASMRHWSSDGGGGGGGAGCGAGGGACWRCASRLPKPNQSRQPTPALRRLPAPAVAGYGSVSGSA